MLEDFKRGDMWALSKHTNGKRVLTRAGAKWENMKMRCGQGRTAQSRFRHREGCVNAFDNFQQFADWCQTQAGYTLSFVLDKDLLFIGNKVYSESTCVFIPSEVNAAITTRDGRNAKVTKIGNKYYARLYASGKVIQKGFKTAEEAAAAYIEAKKANFQVLADKYRNVLREDAYAALRSREVTM